MRKFLRNILIVLNIIVALGLVLAYLCCFVNPEKVWWLSFFGLAYGYLLVANICFMVIWLFSRKKKLTFVSLVAILVGGTMIGRNIQIFAKKLPEAEQSNCLKVASFNVHTFHLMNTKQYNGKQLNIFDFLRERNLDILCMQEFMISKGVNDLKEETIRKRLDNMPYYHLELPMETIGLATFSSYPIIRSQLVYSDKTTNACMFSDLLVGSDTVRVYNMHLKSVGFKDEQRKFLSNAVKKEYNEEDANTIKAIIRQMAKSSFRRAEQVEQIYNHIEQSPYPVIICGDFNDPPMSYSYQKIRGNRKDAFIESGRGRSVTYHIGRISSQRIDHILYSDVFDAYNYRSPRVFLSDHYPVMCLLKIKDKKPH